MLWYRPDGAAFDDGDDAEKRTQLHGSSFTLTEEQYKAMKAEEEASTAQEAPPASEETVAE